jgi:hypothetical protein
MIDPNDEPVGELDIREILDEDEGPRKDDTRHGQYPQIAGPGQP